MPTDNINWADAHERRLVWYNDTRNNQLPHWVGWDVEKAVITCAVCTTWRGTWQWRAEHGVRKVRQGTNQFAKTA